MQCSLEIDATPGLYKQVNGVSIALYEQDCTVSIDYELCSDGEVSDWWPTAFTFETRGQHYVVTNANETVFFAFLQRVVNGDARFLEKLHEKIGIERASLIEEVADYRRDERREWAAEQRREYQRGL